MRLLCRKCNLIQEHSVDKKRNKPHTWCKACQREYSRKHYRANKKDHLERRKLNRYGERKQKLERLRSLKSRPCMDCSIEYPYYVMQFDHRDPSLKSFTISDNIDQKSLEQLVNEARKCDVVCANCHAERTWGKIEH